MLQEVLEYIHNRFIQKSHSGSYSISGGVISPMPELTEGQRFWIVGSALNDGLYTFHSDFITNDDDTAVEGFADEDFDGVICAAAIPKRLLALSADILGWVGQYGAVTNSPYTSESFGGYSYTRGTKSAGAGAGSGVGWQDVFADRLKTWRKLC